MIKSLKHFLKLSQIIAVLIIPLIAILYLFPDMLLLKFIEPLKNDTLALVTSFVNPNINGIDYTVGFLAVPWILYIIVADWAITFIASMDTKKEEIITSLKAKKVAEIRAIKKKEINEELFKKQLVYLVVDLIFSKFTISNLTEEETQRKKDEVKNELFREAKSFNGKLVEDLEFEREDTVGVIFSSQEDALKFMFKFLSAVAIIDDDIQSFGYSINFKAILDSQYNNAEEIRVLDFLEKALRTAENNEICTTNSFADRYKEYGSMKNIAFNSKGTYSINREKVELNSLVY